MRRRCCTGKRLWTASDELGQSMATAMLPVLSSDKREQLNRIPDKLVNVFRGSGKAQGHEAPRRRTARRPSARHLAQRTHSRLLVVFNSDLIDQFEVSLEPVNMLFSVIENMHEYFA